MKTLLIGGTGTLGTALTERLLARGDRVTCFSRSELAQKEYSSRFPDVRMIIGDVRDREALKEACRGQDNVFLLAAIKHVDVAEQNPLEAIKTNVFGALNVADVAVASGVHHVIYSNTDKAVLPITTYGYTKALAQNFLLAQNGRSKTKFSAFNWGNVAASRGSVIGTFVKKIEAGEVVPITDVKMTRFWMTVDQAADFMLATYVDASTTKAMIPPVKAASVVRVVQSIARILGKTAVPGLGIIGLRGTEKLHEVLESTHEGCVRSDTCEQYTDQELDDLLGPIVRRLSAQKTAHSREQGRDGKALRSDSPAPRRPISGDRRGRQLAGA